MRVVETRRALVYSWEVPTSIVPILSQSQRALKRAAMPLLRSSRSAHRVAPALYGDIAPAANIGQLSRSLSAAAMPTATAVGSSGATPAPTRTSDGLLAGENFLAWEQSLGQSRTVRPLASVKSKRLKKSISSSRTVAPQPTAPAYVSLASRASSSAVVVDTRNFEPSYGEEETPWVPGRLEKKTTHLDHEETMYAEKVEAEAEAHKVRAELKRATAELDRQRVEIASLKGLRQATVRTASDEAIRRGRPHSGWDVLRFSTLQKATLPPPPSPFHSDEMEEVSAQAIIATARRIEGVRFASPAYPKA